MINQNNQDIKEIAKDSETNQNREENQCQGLNSGFFDKQYDKNLLDFIQKNTEKRIVKNLLQYYSSAFQDQLLNKTEAETPESYMKDLKNQKSGNFMEVMESGQYMQNYENQRNQQNKEDQEDQEILNNLDQQSYQKLEEKRKSSVFDKNNKIQDINNSNESIQIDVYKSCKRQVFQNFDKQEEFQVQNKQQKNQNELVLEKKDNFISNKNQVKQDNYNDFCVKEERHEQEKKQEEILSKEEKRILRRQKLQKKLLWVVKILTLSQLGVILTWQTTQNLGIQNVLSSSLQGLVMSSIIHEDFDCHFSATFAGMTSYASFVGLIHSILFILAKPFFLGIGGKLGSISMIASLLGCLLIEGLERKSYVYPLFDKKYYFQDMSKKSYIDPIFCILGSILTLLIRKHTKVKNHLVFASCVVGASASFLVPIFCKSKAYQDIITVIYVGSFVGMSAEGRVGGFFGFFLAGLFTGYFLYGLNGTFLVGGKYGFSAFLGVYTQVFFRRVYRKCVLKRYRKWKGRGQRNQEEQRNLEEQINLEDLENQKKLKYLEVEKGQEGQGNLQDLQDQEDLKDYQEDLKDLEDQEDFQNQEDQEGQKDLVNGGNGKNIINPKEQQQENLELKNNQEYYINFKNQINYFNDLEKFSTEDRIIKSENGKKDKKYQDKQGNKSQNCDYSSNISVQ
ncbi:hypothetical protein PPERSA_08640 [Pseudocohnilembus persalinus]|uniref:Uncharacterized protein n=1 Tax=Pseudocohnilembus persalinus TaxID=266149 RepID=A0A0V0R613_PSEPJ|nr:hypothetical protein PPERSA_08640 [Pseudocohnilembus persalinus]|eukprot:KRX09608.1 hypothetical protein PPERSA_08640 [Pseudocohnilembus persalinus]